MCGSLHRKGITLYGTLKGQALRPYTDAEGQWNKVPAAPIGKQPLGTSTGGHESYVQRSYSGWSNMYAPGCLGPFRLSCLISTECTHNLLSKDTFGHLPATIKERLGPWDTSHMLYLIHVDTCFLTVAGSLCTVRSSWQIGSGTHFLTKAPG